MADAAFPGTIEPGKIDIAGVIKQTFGVLRRNLATFFLLSLLFSGLPTTVIGYIQASALGSASVGSFNSAAVASSLIGVVAAVIAASVLQGALVYATVQDLNGRKPALGDCLATGLRSFLPLLGVSILFGLAVAGGMILLIVPGIMIAVAWCVCVPALVIDRTSVRGAFGRAGDLTRGNRWRIFGLFVLAWIAMVVVGAIVGGVITGLVLSGQGMNPAAIAISPIQLVVNALLNTVISALGSTLIAVLYVELRRARDGTGAEGLADIFS